MSQAASVPHRALAWALGATLLLRLVHLYFALRSPLTFQPGPDEAYYIEFGRDVAFGSGGLRDMFAFMDPLYGYLVGAVLRLSGSLFALYLLQVIVDTATAYGLFRIAHQLGRPRAGLVAVVLYAVTGTAIAYTSAVLKSTCDVAFLTWWMVLLLQLIREPRPFRWFVFGLWCGVGVALRSNLLLMTPFALAVAWICSTGPRTGRAWMVPALTLVAGLALPLALLAARNHAISGNFSALPTNGGIVLHQLYNGENPESRSAVPSFVGHYSAPFDIWRGYAREAERRAGRPLRPHEVSAYWGVQATSYMRAHPVDVLQNAMRKLREFSAFPEVPNTRNYADDRLFSPVLSALPLPFGWLFALGLPGLALWLRDDRRVLVLLAPLAMGVITIAVFFAEDRFRFDIIAPFVLGSAFAIVAAAKAAMARRWRPLLAGAAISLALGAWSIVQARLLIPEFPSDWQRIAWGYLRSGRQAQAEATLLAVARDRPDAPGLHALLGFIALRNGRPGEARAHLATALAHRDDVAVTWHNFSLALERTGELPDALRAATAAERLDPSASAAMRRGDLLLRMGDVAGARAAWAEGLQRQSSGDVRAELRQRLASTPNVPASRR